jgi:hypothetical protein
MPANADDLTPSEKLFGDYRKTMTDSRLQSLLLEKIEEVNDTNFVRHTPSSQAEVNDSYFGLTITSFKDITEEMLARSSCCFAFGVSRHKATGTAPEATSAYVGVTHAEPYGGFESGKELKSKKDGVIRAGEISEVLLAKLNENDPKHEYKGASEQWAIYKNITHPAEISLGQLAEIFVDEYTKLQEILPFELGCTEPSE